MPSAVFEPAIPAGERLQTHALDRSATGIGKQIILQNKIQENVENWTETVAGNEQLMNSSRGLEISLEIRIF
jgi:hypothetical protein